MLALYTDRIDRLSAREIAPQPLTIAFATSGLGSLLFSACALLWAGIPTEYRLDRVASALPNRLALWQLLGAGVVSTAVPFLCYTAAARRLPPYLPRSPCNNSRRGGWFSVAC